MFSDQLINASYSHACEYAPKMLHDKKITIPDQVLLYELCKYAVWLFDYDVRRLVPLSYVVLTYGLIPFVRFT